MLSNLKSTFYVGFRGRSTLVFQCACIALFLGSPLIRFIYPNEGYRAAFADDFYYYLVVAEHLLQGKPSFDGVIWTNGFHPLWLGLIVVLLQLAGGSNWVFFLLLTLTISGFVIGYLFYIARVGNILADGDRLSVVFTFHSAFFLLVISRSGMEVSAACFLIAMLVYRLMQLPFLVQNFTQAAVTGFLASLMILARLDTALLVVCMSAVLITSAWRQRRELLVRGVGFAIGGVLLPAYLLSNRLIFETWLPISGQAKQLRDSFVPALRPLQSLVIAESTNMIFVFPAIVVNAIGLVLLALGQPQRLAQSVRQVAAAVLLMPPLFYTTHAVMSDWQLWSWYFYPLVLALGIGGPLIVAMVGSRLRLPWLRPVAVASIVALACLLVGLRQFARPPERNYIYMAAHDIRTFAQQHPGVYSMGDRAGIVGYFLRERLVQTEGLVMDKKFLAHIKQERNLIDVLQEYNVSYHIATNPVKQGDCYRVDEPKRAGKNSPRMVGYFCTDPLMQVHYRFSTTMIFKVPTL